MKKLLKKPHFDIIMEYLLPSVVFYDKYLKKFETH